MICESSVIEIGAKIEMVGGRKINAGGMHQSRRHISVGISFFQVDTCAIRITCTETGGHVAFSGKPAIVSALVLKVIRLIQGCPVGIQVVGFKACAGAEISCRKLTANL